MAIISYDDLLDCLQIERLGEDLYTAPNIPMPYYRIFGGQLLAQAIALATATTEGKVVKSLHVTFPRQGDLRKPVEYSVERMQDGRSFSGLWLVGRQEGKAIFTASLSLHVEEAGLEHQLDAPRVEGPEEASPCELSMIPWETRSVGAVDLAARDTGPPSYEFWMKTPELPEDPMVHQALLAYATDLTLIGTTLRPHPDLGEEDSPERIQTAVTTHTLWFHRPCRVDEWMLLAQTSPSAAGARGFGLGHAFNREGVLAASFAQESMIRPV